MCYSPTRYTRTDRRARVFELYLYPSSADSSTRMIEKSWTIGQQLGIRSLLVKIDARRRYLSSKCRDTCKTYELEASDLPIFLFSAERNLHSTVFFATFDRRSNYQNLNVSASTFFFFFFYICDAHLSSCRYASSEENIHERLKYLKI